jgi:tetratricopeptide (TPR) repeat protein
MRSRFVALSWAALVLAALPVFAQEAQPKQPRPKSQKEVDALKKVQADATAQNWGQEIQDINSVLENFADTDYKPMLLNMAMEAAQKQGDYGQTVAYGEQIVQSDPNDITARVTLAQAIARHTRENDLDKDQSIKKIQDYANKALDLLKNNPPPPVGVPADQWGPYQKQLQGEAHDALATAADLSKNYAGAVTEYQAAYAAFPNPIILTHLGKAYLDNKQYDDAISTADKVLADGTAPAQIKQLAQQQKDAATKMKGAK